MTANKFRITTMKVLEVGGSEIRVREK